MRRIMVICIVLFLLLKSGNLSNASSDSYMLDNDNTSFLPVILNQSTNLSVDPSDRQASLQFFNSAYHASEGADIQWAGDVDTCNEGTTSDAFRDAVSLRINYFRAMAGVPGNVILFPEYTQKAQKAALMMSANHSLSHNPPSTWKCYSMDGATAAGSSNLYLGVYSWAAIDGYMADLGTGNFPVGHRRWILYPQTQKMGSGDIPNNDNSWPANALWVFDDNMWGPRPETREEFVAWPPPGYVPYPVVYPRWSFSYDNADFSEALVTMSKGGDNIPVIAQPVVYGYGENTLVWEPELDYGSPPTSDEIYSVTVSSVLISEQAQNFSYQVIIFDPGSQGNHLEHTNSDSHLGDPPEW